MNLQTLGLYTVSADAVTKMLSYFVQTTKVELVKQGNTTIK